MSGDSMSASNEEFVRGRGMKISTIRMLSNNYTQPCIDCGNKVYRGTGSIVKPEDGTKIGTVCRGCDHNWISLDTMKNPAVMKSMRDMAELDDKIKARKAEKEGTTDV
jgi:hypothetical protein